ncbi:hypothetical protein DL98DRAFT_651717 [Cadophora sp. DSE1049]|nr:hypothetical protein DL98DRAFT_651717 [Cadophora sp. DSE1049]
MEVEVEVEHYTSITPKLLSKAKQAPYKYSGADIDRAKATCEDRLFEGEYAGPQPEVMKWQAQRWLWNTLFPNETDRFPGTKPRELPVVKKEDAPKGLSAKIRKSPIEKEDKKSKHEEKASITETSALSPCTEVPRTCTRCGSRTHEEHACTSKVLQERVLQCSVSGHDVYIFGKAAGCPKCLRSV